MQAAASMVERLRSGMTIGIIRDMEKLSDAYIELAEWDVSQFKKVTSKQGDRFYTSFVFKPVEFIALMK